MKINATIFIIILLYSITSCKKETASKPETPSTERAIKFHLYTTKDFSTDTQNIVFTLRIQNGVKVYFDSSLAPMKVKDIPNFANKMVFEKKLPDSVTSKLLAGFIYSLENVGNSWYYDTCNAKERVKVIDYNFQ